MALGAEKGEMLLHVDDKGTYAPSLRKTTPGLKQVIKVTVDSVNNLIEVGLIDVPDVVKTDVEGAEDLVLDGMKGLLTSKHRPKHIFIEIHDFFLPQFGSSTK